MENVVQLLIDRIVTDRWWQTVSDVSFSRVQVYACSCPGRPPPALLQLPAPGERKSAGGRSGTGID